MSRPYEPQDIFLLQQIVETDAAWDDNLLAITVESVDGAKNSAMSALWLAPMQGGQPRQVTWGPSDFMPRWSPDGRQLAFLSMRGDSTQVYLLPMEGGEARQLTHLPGPVTSLAWSPRGDRLAVTCSLEVDSNLRGARPAPDAPPPDENAPQVAWKLPYKLDGAGFILSQEIHLFCVDATSGEHRQVTDGPFDVRSVAWSPDGAQLAFTRTREGDESHRTDVWCCDPEGANARRLTTRQSQVLYPAWSPDGHWLVFSGTEAEGDAQTRLWCIDLRSGNVQGLGSEDLEISSEGESVRFPRDDSSRVLAVVARRGVQEAVQVTVPGGELTRLAGGERQLSHLACSKDYLAYMAQSAVEPPEVFARGRDGRGERRLGRFNAWSDERVPGRVERRSFQVPDGRGGTETIDGWWIHAEGRRDGPLLVDMHGGPASYVLFDAAAHGYWQVLWSRGWSILALNAVGSASYGRAFADRLNGHWGERDLPQVLAAVEQMQSAGLADRRVAITGKSYGGFLTAWAIGSSHVFRAAVVQAPVGNIETHFGTSDSGYYADSYTFGGGPREAHETMTRLSPNRRAERARTPTLILQGLEDERCPKCQAEELFVTLRRGANPPSELVLYPGGSHKFSSSGLPSHRLDVVRRAVAWLERWIDRELPR